MFPKSKLALANLIILLIIIGGIRLVESGPEPWLDSEKVFMSRLHNSLYYLDLAKDQWASDKNEPETAVPTFEDLAPYLGEWKDQIERLKALGIEYKITSRETPQSDVAILTQGIRFRAAFCPFYKAGTTLCLQTGWMFPPPNASPITLRIRLTLLRANLLLEAAFFILVLVNVIIFAVRKLTSPKSSVASQDAPSATPSTNAALPSGIRAKDLYVLIFGALFCLLGLGFLSAIPPLDEGLIQKMDNVLGLILTGASLLLPILSLRFLKTNPGTQSKRIALRSAYLVSLVPAACILWAFLSTRFVPLPCHVYESDTKRIVKGMTKDQVLQAIGAPRGSSSGDRKTRLTYDLQIAWGRSGRQFFVDLIDDKVTSARIVRYGGEPNDDFWDTDFVKDLKAGKVLPNATEVEQACLAVCKKEAPETTAVTVSDIDLCLLENFKNVRATGNVIMKYSDGTPDSMKKPFTMVLTKGPAGWHPMEYDLMGTKGVIQDDAANSSTDSAREQ